MRDITWHPAAWGEYQNLLSDRTRVKKLNALIKDIMRNGYHCSLGKPEKLKGNLSGYHSVHITHGERLIFRVTKTDLYILSCTGHYDDH